jgi:hypothetical protein
MLLVLLLLLLLVALHSPLLLLLVLLLFLVKLLSSLWPCALRSGRDATCSRGCAARGVPADRNIPINVS